MPLFKINVYFFLENILKFLGQKLIAGFITKIIKKFFVFHSFLRGYH